MAKTMILQEYNENSKIDHRWIVRYDVLVNYIKTTGSIYMPERKKGVMMEPWKQKMIAWCSIQRMNYKSGKMLTWQYDKLKRIGFIFDPKRDRLEENFNELMEFKKKYGHVKVPTTSKEYPILATWIQTLRHTPPTGELKERLDAEGFVWRVVVDNWDKKFGELKAFWKKHGHVKVPKVYEGSTSLNCWIKGLRKMKKRKDQTYLTEERIKKLNYLGFEWAPMKDGWEKQFNKLCRYMKCNGGKLIRLTYQHDTTFISWLNQTRKNKENLSKDRIDKLNKLGFNWKPMIDKWEKNFNELACYKQEHGNCRVPFKTEGSQALYAWTCRMRRDKAKLSEEKIAMLDSIGFDWEFENTTPDRKITKNTGRAKTKKSKAKATVNDVVAANEAPTVNEDSENNPLQYLINYYN